MNSTPSRTLRWDKRTLGAVAAAAGALALTVTVATHPFSAHTRLGAVADIGSQQGGCQTYDVSGTQGWNIGVCISGNGLTASPDIYVNSIGNTGTSCTIDIETWDGSNDKLGDTPVTCPTSAPAHLKADQVTASTATTVHAFARLRLDGVAYSSGDSTPVDLSPDGNAPAPGGPSPTAQANATSSAAPDNTGARNGCMIEVRAKPVPVAGVLGFMHLFIIYTDATGTQYYFRGGPTGGGDDRPGVFGYITTESGQYVNGTVDWYPNAQSITVANSLGACSTDACLAGTLDHINNAQIQYVVTGPNSNTVVRTMLSDCGLPQNKPNVNAPGWNSPMPGWDQPVPAA